MGESRTLASERGSEREHREARVDSAMKEDRFQGQAKRTSLGEVGERMNG